jgi:hypothetical protein
VALKKRTASAFWLTWLALVTSACSESYRVGEYVMVLWQQEGPYPAYILKKKDKRWYRVHFDGYPESCDEDVSLDRIQGRVEATPTTLPPPAGITCVIRKPVPGAGAPAPYKENDRVRVVWRGSVYTATITKVIAHDKFLVHYEGYEKEWDETVPLDRIIGRRSK